MKPILQSALALTMACSITVAGGSAFLASSDEFPGHQIVTAQKADEIFVVAARLENSNEVYARLFDRVQPALNFAMYETGRSIETNLASLDNPLPQSLSFVVASN